MKNRNGMLVALLLLASCRFALGQMEKPWEQLDAGQVLDAWVTNAEREIVSAAQAMPEDKYSFVPFVPTGGDFKGARTFAEQVKHLAAANYQLSARILQENPPAGTVGTKNETAPDSVKTKAEIMEHLKGSFAYLHKAAASIHEKNTVEPIPGATGTWQRTRLGLAVDAIAHSYDHYGQIVEYLRMNAIVPPASR
jgi:DinB superfamily